MAQRLTDVHITKIDLVGRPAIRRGITLFKSEDEVDGKKLLELIKELEDGDKAEILKALDVPDLKEQLKNLSDEDRPAIIKALGLEPEKEPLKDRVLKALGLTSEPADDDILKGLDEPNQKVVGVLRDEIKKSRETIEALDERVKKGETELEKRDAEKSRNEAIEIAKSLERVGFVADDHAEAIDNIRKSNPEAWKKLEPVLKAANEQAKTSKLFEEFSPDGPGAGSAWSEINSKAEDLMKADSKITIEQARAKIMKSHPDLYARQEAERNAIRKERS